MLDIMWGLRAPSAQEGDLQAFSLCGSQRVILPTYHSQIRPFAGKQSGSLIFYIQEMWLDKICLNSCLLLQNTEHCSLVLCSGVWG